MKKSLQMYIFKAEVNKLTLNINPCHEVRDSGKDCEPLVFTGELVHDAINFAVLKHSGQIRKGTVIPYITHPFEVMEILAEFGSSEQVKAAGMLHDVLEDTDASPEEIRNIFGENVLGLVAAESEDKSKTWKERKQAAIDSLQNAKFENKLICLADKLSNLRSMSADIKSYGEKLWNRFNASKKEIEWYYRQIFGKLSDFRNYGLYQEYSSLLDEVFCGS